METCGSSILSTAGAIRWQYLNHPSSSHIDISSRGLLVISRRGSKSELWLYIMLARPPPFRCWWPSCKSLHPAPSTPTHRLYIIVESHVCDPPLCPNLHCSSCSALCYVIDGSPLMLMQVAAGTLNLNAFLPEGLKFTSCI